MNRLSADTCTTKCAGRSWRATRFLKWYTAGLRATAPGHVIHDDGHAARTRSGLGFSDDLSAGVSAARQAAMSPIGAEALGFKRGDRNLAESPAKLSVGGPGRNKVRSQRLVGLGSMGGFLSAFRQVGDVLRALLEPLGDGFSQDAAADVVAGEMRAA